MYVLHISVDAFFSLFFWLDDMNNLASSQSVVEPDLADQFVLSLGGGL